MADTPALHWLPEEPDFRARLQTLSSQSGDAWPDLCRLAQTRLDFLQTNRLGEALLRASPQPPDIRLAVLSSCTMAHLHAGLRVGAARRGLSLVLWEGGYGQYMQALLAPDPDLAAFRPNAVLLAFDARHLGALAAQDDADATETVLAHLKQLWAMARDRFGCQILQQTILNTHPPLLGSNEHRLPGSPHQLVLRLNAALREAADRAGVDLVAVDQRVATDGLHAWHDRLLWDRAKQDIRPTAAPFYGDLVARVIAARHGRSRKALVLDLDNTLWGGVVGDDGVDGIVLGQGSALGEGFASLQHYARDLARRGVILAVASKNDATNALAVFDRQPDMVLRREDIAAFRIDWNDKAANLRAIAQDLNIGLDALVFLDDNPAERALIRQELPMVAVPDMPEDPALAPQMLADAGYFEAVAITAEDRARAGQYAANRDRAALQAGSTDLAGFLAGLDMHLRWRRCDAANLARVAQLIGKTNQFNLTTRRHAEDDLRGFLTDPAMICLQFRLQDRFGDNGLIAVILARCEAGTCRIDTWVMSCRVLGRQVERACLDVLARLAIAQGASALLGEYIPTDRNGMVRDHYGSLGFTPEDGGLARLGLHGFSPLPCPMSIEEDRD